MPAFSRRHCRIAAVVSSIATLGVAAALGAAHRVLLINAPVAAGSVEWDFYYSYARDAIRIASLLPPLDEFRGPLYPLVLALIHAALPFASLFTIAKGVSAVSAAVAVVTVYFLVEETVSPAWGVAVSVALAATSPFLLLGFLAGTDMFFAALSLGAFYFVVRSLSGQPRAVIAAGILQGLAMSARWNAVFLPAATVASLALASRLSARLRLQLAAAFIATFLGALAPWLVLNWSLHGDPFFNRNGINAAIGIYGQERSFDSLSDAFAFAPATFLTRWATNVAVYAARLGSAILPLTPLSIAGLGILIARGRRQPAPLALVLFGFAVLTVNAVGPFVPRQYLVVVPLFLAAAAALGHWILGFHRWRRIAGPAIALVWVVSVLSFAVRSTEEVRRVLQTEALQSVARRGVAVRPAAPIFGDWDGSGKDRIGLVRDGNGYEIFYLFRGYTSGPAAWIAAYGPERAVPLAGRWSRRSADGIGVFNAGGFFLKERVFSGFADVVATFGGLDDLPVTGDWNGDGIDTIGTFREGVMTLTDQIAAPFVIVTFTFGGAGDRPVAGDWNGDGTDTVGVYRDGVFMLTNRSRPPFDDIWEVPTGLRMTDATPMAGDRTGTGVDSPALYTQDGTFYFFDRENPQFLRVDLNGLADLPVAGEADGPLMVPGAS